MCETFDTGSCIRWVLGFGIKPSMTRTRWHHALVATVVCSSDGRLTSQCLSLLGVTTATGNLTSHYQLLLDRLSHPIFKAKTRCSSYVCPGSSQTYGQNVSTEYQCLYYIVSYYKNSLHVQKGLNSEMDPILPQTVDRGFRTPRRTLHQHTPHLLSSRTWQQYA
jgi:hypothetical protein